MNLIILELKKKIFQPIDLTRLSQINNMKFNNKILTQISVPYDGKNFKLRDLFSFKVKRMKENKRKVILKGSNIFFNNVGANWRNDDLEVFGDVGSFVGKKMQSGILRINGSCENFLGCQMKGGNILISKNAKDYIGAPDFGEKLGMNGGNIFINGNAGNHLGYLMRRGLIVVNGGVGEYCANKFIAGTVIIKKNIGRFFCMGMKRGTIILFKRPKNIEKMFKTSGIQILDFFSTLQKYSFPFFSKKNRFNRFEKFVKGNIKSGLGEILVLQKKNFN